MTVYFAQTRIDVTKVKIGWTSNVEARRANMSVSVPGGISIMATIAGGKETEDYLHGLFEADRIGGEWFNLSEGLSSFIRDVQNGKTGLIPFVDTAEYMVRNTAEYSRDAVEIAGQMAAAVLNDEFKGVGDTIEAAAGRIQTKHGLSTMVFMRLRYRKKNDIWAGEYLHIKAIYEQRLLSKKAEGNVTEFVTAKRS